MRRVPECPCQQPSYVLFRAISLSNQAVESAGELARFEHLYVGGSIELELPALFHLVRDEVNRSVVGAR
jgi:hypothetical protein